MLWTAAGCALLLAVWLCTALCANLFGLGITQVTLWELDPDLVFIIALQLPDSGGNPASPW